MLWRTTRVDEAAVVLLVSYAPAVQSHWHQWKSWKLMFKGALHAVASLTTQQPQQIILSPGIQAVAAQWRALRAAVCCQPCRRSKRTCPRARRARATSRTFPRQQHPRRRRLHLRAETATKRSTTSGSTCLQMSSHKACTRACSPSASACSSSSSGRYFGQCCIPPTFHSAYG